MFPIVDIVTSPPTMNTHSKKHHLPMNHPIHQLKNVEAILNTRYYFFSLPNSLDDDTYVHLIQCSTCLYDLQDLTPEELADHKRRKKNWVRQRKMKRIREEAEKIV